MIESIRSLIENRPLVLAVWLVAILCLIDLVVHRVLDIVRNHKKRKKRKRK